MDATSKTPAGGRGLQDHAYLDALGQLYGTGRDKYHGTPPLNASPDPRDPLPIAQDLYTAAERLADLAEDFAAGACYDGTLSAADALLVGLGRLIVEARAQRQAQRGTP